MTNINCSENCRHQENGKCRLTHIGIMSVIGGSKCAYFEQKYPHKAETGSKTGPPRPGGKAPIPLE